MRSQTILRVAAVQAAPAWLDREATLAIVVDRIREAAREGAQLVAFPETFVPGYPVWVDITPASAWENPAQQEAYAWYLEQSVDLDGPEFQRVIDVCRETGVFAYVGVAERSRSGGSIYCSLVAIHPETGVVGVHRKLKPTFGERLVWADGDGAGLRVHGWQGARVSGLNCWENWMPLARAALYAQGTQIHVAAWPGARRLTEDITRFVAREGRTFVVSVGGIYRPDHLPDGFPLEREMRGQGDAYYDGGTVIAGPTGDLICGPFTDEERIVVADLDLGEVRRARQNFDAAGHYSRPDVLKLEVDAERRSP